MTTPATDLYYDSADLEIGRDPYPVFKRLREEAPLYYNEVRDFYALSRYDDVSKALLDNESYISGKGDTLDFIKSGMTMPPGTLLFEDPPSHTVHRALVSRMFTPKKMAALDPQVRQFCVDTLDPLVGAGGFDFVTDFAVEIPMRVIGMLLGIPWDQQEAIRDFFAHASQHGMDEEDGELSHDLLSNTLFADYVDWRAANPSDDVVTELMNVEFEDEHGVRRRLRREELLMYINILAAAGNETTARLISFCGQLFGDHPDQRHELAADPGLVANAVEEVLRYEPPALQDCRYVARTVEHYGQTVPAGSALVLVLASANRDERHYDDPERFDIHRKGAHMSFGFGPHYCLGANLARLEARIALEEVLKRFPDWEVDRSRAKFVVSAELRSWGSLPIVTK